VPGDGLGGKGVRGQPDGDVGGHGVSREVLYGGK